MGLGRQRCESKYLAVKYFYEEKQWSISWMCRQLDISRAACYKWLDRPIPEQESENIKLAGLIKEYDERFGHILGYRRMTGWISHFNHTSYSKNRAHRIMKKLGIHSVIRKKKKKYQPYKPEAAADNKLVSDTYDRALKENPDAEPVFHSDRGYQYTSRVFREMLQKQGMEQSMSRVRHCIDNGPTEGLWGIIKSEIYCMYGIGDEKSLRSAIDEYMKFYAEERPQERFLCKTPPEVRREALSTENPVQYPIAENRRINAYKAKWCA